MVIRIIKTIIINYKIETTMVIVVKRCCTRARDNVANGSDVVVSCGWPVKMKQQTQLLLVAKIYTNRGLGQNVHSDTQLAKEGLVRVRLGLLGAMLAADVGGAGRQ